MAAYALRRIGKGSIKKSYDILFCQKCLLKRENLGKTISRFISTPRIADFVSISENYTKDGGTSTETDWTHFGYEEVREKEKSEKVYKVFESVAESYDLMNDLMSGGLHRLWKDFFVKNLNPRPGTKLLDVAGGTGDIAFRYLDGVTAKLKNEKEGSSPHNSTEIVVCDINRSMLEVGKRRAKTKGISKLIHWVEGNAEELPFEDNSFDIYTIAFGIRNVTRIQKTLEEAYRVLKPGGRFACIEFSHVSNPLIQRLYDSYSFQMIPVMGALIANDWKSYQYLVESIRKFPTQSPPAQKEFIGIPQPHLPAAVAMDEFSEMIRQAGFSEVAHKDLTFGVVAIHSGFKLYLD